MPSEGAGRTSSSSKAMARLLFSLAGPNSARLAEHLREVVREFRQLELVFPIARLARHQVLMDTHGALVIRFGCLQSRDVLRALREQNREIVVHARQLLAACAFSGFCANGSSTLIASPKSGIRRAKRVIVRFGDRAEQNALVVVGPRELLLIRTRWRGIPSANAVCSASALV